jgi:hypothetical protein
MEQDPSTTLALPGHVISSVPDAHANDQSPEQGQLTSMNHTGGGGGLFFVQPPIVPKILHDGDSGNFDEYDEKDFESFPELPERDLQLFANW